MLRRRKRRAPIRRVPRPRFPVAVEAQYAAALVARLAPVFRSLEEHVLPALPALAVLASRLDAAEARADDVPWAEKLGELVARARLGFGPEEDPDQLAAAVAARVNAASEAEQRRLVKAAFGVDVLSARPRLQGKLGAFARENAALIRSQRREVVAEVERMALAGLRAGRRHEAIAKDLRGRFGVARSKARFLARDQVAKLNGQLTQARQEAVGVEEYVWRTAGDERVRPSHLEKEGKTFRWDDPPADTGAPGEDYQCRCTAEPKLEAAWKDLEGGDEAGDEMPEHREEPAPELSEAFDQLDAEPAVSPTTGEALEDPRSPGDSIASSFPPLSDSGLVELSPEAMAALDALAAREAGAVTPVLLRTLRSNQPSVRRAQVRSMMRALKEGKPGGPPSVVQLRDGTRLIHDGHHRLEAALRSGASKAEVRLVKEREVRDAGPVRVAAAVPRARGFRIPR